jgi:hypothetical protein
VKQRWKFSKVAGSEDTGWAEQLVLNDQKSGMSFIQKGDRFDLVGVDTTKVKPPPSKALEYLGANLDNESDVTMFADKYGYLPSWAIRALQPDYAQGGEAAYQDDGAETLLDE